MVALQVDDWVVPLREAKHPLGLLQLDLSSLDQLSTVLDLVADDRSKLLRRVRDHVHPHADKLLTHVRQRVCGGWPDEAFQGDERLLIVADQFRGYGGKILRTTLSPDQQAKVEMVLSKSAA